MFIYWITIHDSDDHSLHVFMALIIYAVMENSSLLFSSNHLKLLILENNRLLAENNQLFFKITTQKIDYFPIAACYFPKYQALDDYFPNSRF